MKSCIAQFQSSQTSSIPGFYHGKNVFPSLGLGKLKVVLQLSLERQIIDYYSSDSVGL